LDNENPAKADEDIEFVLLCQKGDPNAFEPLVERYQKRMFNIAYRMTGDYEEAGEVVQEAFISAFKAIKKFRGEARFSTWLTGITINHAKNHLKQMNRHSHYEESSSNNPVECAEDVLSNEYKSSEIPIVERLERKELQENVQKCIDLLDEEYKEVLVLRDMQGFSYDEIRDMLKIPEGTVKSRLFRARDAMKKCLKKVIGNI